MALMHDSPSPKLIVQKIREELLAHSFGPVGAVAIPREIGERYVKAFVLEGARRHFSAPPPPSEESRTMLQAFKGQGLLFLPTRGSPGPHGSVFPICKSTEKYSLIGTLYRLIESRPQAGELHAPDRGGPGCPSEGCGARVRGFLPRATARCRSFGMY